VHGLGQIFILDIGVGDLTMIWPLLKDKDLTPEPSWIPSPKWMVGSNLYP
jgi:hypothetical protein